MTQQDYANELAVFRFQISIFVPLGTVLIVAVASAIALCFAFKLVSLCH